MHIEVLSHPVIASAYRGDICPCRINTVTVVNTSRGNFRASKNPFSYAIQSADQLLGDISDIGLITVHSSHVPSISPTTIVITSQNNIRPP